MYGEALLVLHGSHTFQALDSLCSSLVEEPQGELIRFCRYKIMAYIFDFRYEAVSYGEMPTHEKHVPFTLL